jgi:plastocyanin domain-containing protein
MKIDAMVRQTISLLAVVFVLGPVPAFSHEHRDPRRIEIDVTDKGFEPSRIPVLRNEEVALIFTRRTDRTCAKEVLVQIDRRDPSKRIAISLGLNKPSVLTLRFVIYGDHTFACSAGTKSGTIVVD